MLAAAASCYLLSDIGHHHPDCVNKQFIDFDLQQLSFLKSSNFSCEISTWWNDDIADNVESEKF